VNYQWQQPIRPLEVQRNGTNLWIAVLFIRPRTAHGWDHNRVRQPPTEGGIRPGRHATCPG